MKLPPFDFHPHPKYISRKYKNAITPISTTPASKNLIVLPESIPYGPMTSHSVPCSLISVRSKPYLQNPILSTIPACSFAEQEVQHSSATSQVIRNAKRSRMVNSNNPLLCVVEITSQKLPANVPSRRELL